MFDDLGICFPFRNQLCRGYPLRHLLHLLKGAQVGKQRFDVCLAAAVQYGAVQ